MGWRLDDLVNLVVDKFIKTPLIDVTTPITEMESVKLAVTAIRSWGVRMSEVIDIPKWWHLMFYHDDEYASKLIAGKDDQMQTAKATLFSLTGDCEDVHRLYQLMAIALGTPPQNSKLMILFFGDKEKIIGGHATALVIKEGAYINLDYSYAITSENINGILKYHARYGNPVAYVLLTPDPKSILEVQVRYQTPKAYYANADGRYNIIEVKETKALANVKKHLHRSAERDIEDKTKQIIFSLGLLAGGILIGGMIR